MRVSECAILLCLILHFVLSVLCVVVFFVLLLLAIVSRCFYWLDSSFMCMSWPVCQKCKTVSLERPIKRRSTKKHTQQPNKNTHTHETPTVTNMNISAFVWIAMFFFASADFFCSLLTFLFSLAIFVDRLSCLMFTVWLYFLTQYLRGFESNVCVLVAESFLPNWINYTFCGKHKVVTIRLEHCTMENDVDKFKPLKYTNRAQPKHTIFCLSLVLYSFCNVFCGSRS